MLEPLARSGAARRLAWRHGDHTVHTPLVVARPGPRVPQQAALLLGEHDPLPNEKTPRAMIQITGGFLESHQTGPETEPRLWARLHVPRAAMVNARLTRLQTPHAPAPLVEFDDRANGSARPDAHSTKSPLTNANADANATALAPLGEGGQQDLSVHVSELLAVAPGLTGDAGHPDRFAARLVEAREAAGAGRLLMVPGVALVHHAALLVYAGVDLLDTLAVERATHAGWYLTAEGAHEAKTLESALCPCTVCSNTAPQEMDHEALLEHNIQALMDEQTRIRGHIDNDSLRGLVETRARAHPATAAVLRQLDRHLAHYARRWPLVNKGKVLATTQESLTRPDVARYRQRIQDDYLPPQGADVLLLLPCSAKKPYARSSSHRIFRRILGDIGAASRVHEVILTSPMGVVPRELENTYPAAHYDVPVTGHWDREERHMIRHQLKALLAKGAYTKIISHLDAGTQKIVADLLPENTPHTAQPHPTKIPARDALRRALRDATRGTPAPPWPKRRRMDAHAILTWQTGPQAADVLIGATADVSGRPPGMRLYMERGNKRPLATFVSARGLFAYTLRAAELLHEAGHARTVTIDDFTPRGTLFAVGVKDADPEIVPGDEVVLVHDGEVRGVGRALLTGDEMKGYPRGKAVEVRHHG